MNTPKLGIVPTAEIANMTAVLYSAEQDCYHLEPMQEYLKNNIQHALCKEAYNSYQLISIAKDDLTGNDIVAQFRIHQANFKNVPR